MNIIIAGGSGFLGTALVKKLTSGNHTVVLLSRNPAPRNDAVRPNVQIEQWDAKNQGSWSRRLEGADAVINLTGESIGGKRWTNSQKEMILSSRIDSTRVIVEAIRFAKKRPNVLINQSAVGYYGNVPEGDVTESRLPGDDFLAHVCRQWEAEARNAESLGVRVVLPRTGIVLDKRGGALPRFLLPFNFFIGGPLGSGKQWFPWIHLDDETGGFVFALEDSNLSGPINLAAPEPATMKQFCDALGEAMHRPSWAPVPGFALKILLGEMADALVLSGQKVIPKQLSGSGYTFRFPMLSGALKDILGKS